MIRTHKKELLHLSDKMMETLISLTNMVNKTFNEMDMLGHQIKKIDSDIENLKQKVPRRGNKLYPPETHCPKEQITVISSSKLALLFLNDLGLEIQLI